jgi:hypothetical protein
VPLISCRKIKNDQREVVATHFFWCLSRGVMGALVLLSWELNRIVLTCTGSEGDAS